MRYLQSKFWFAILPLATGAGLVAHILANFSLVLGVALAAFMGLVAAYTVWYRTSQAARPAVKRRVVIGLGAGILATVAYDTSRYIIVTFLALSFWPF